MNHIFSTSLLISTYNWPEALELVLKSVQQQSVLPQEILLADDGSTKVTRELIENFKKHTSIPVLHIWHPDTGFNRSSILNKAIVQATGTYILQTDGDCILHKDFVKDHVSFAAKKTYLFGSRVSIKQERLAHLFSTKEIVFQFFSKGIKKRSRTLRIPFLSHLFSPKPSVSKKLRGCNVSFWKEDFIAVNGYNEDMTGWGREDSELMIRMSNNGIKGRRLKYKGIVYHIWHKTSSKSNLNVNETIQNEAIRENKKRCSNGIDKYL